MDDHNRCNHQRTIHGKTVDNRREAILREFRFFIILYLFRFHLLSCRRVTYNKGFKLSVGERFSLLHDFGFEKCTCMKARKKASAKAKGLRSFAELCSTPLIHPYQDQILLNRTNRQGRHPSDYFIVPRGKIWRTVFDLGG